MFSCSNSFNFELALERWRGGASEGRPILLINPGGQLWCPAPSWCLWVLLLASQAVALLESTLLQLAGCKAKGHASFATQCCSNVNMSATCLSVMVRTQGNL
eukprot:1141113-Pelagomonas_calceolata.AAC.4